MEKIKIFLTKGIGRGQTEESAYCEALRKAGIINLNLIKLSSVLPHNATIISRRPHFSYNDYGKRLYVILAEARASKKGVSISAGVGWVTELGGSGNGLVVQAVGRSGQEVRRSIDRSLSDIIRRASLRYRKGKIVTETAVCGKNSVCVLVTLVFTLEKWV